MRLIDACCIVLGKDDYQREIRAFLKAAELTKYEFYAVAMITIGYHAKYYALKNDNKPLPFLPTTANGRDNVLDYDAINFNNQGFCNFACIKLFQCVPHGECWGRKTYLLQYSVQEMVEIGRSLVGFYSCFADLGDLDQLSESAGYTDEVVHHDLSTIKEGVRVVGSVIAFRYGGVISMTQEERDALVKGRLFFYRCGTLASFLFGKGEGLEDDIEMNMLYEEMLECVGGDSDSFEKMLSAKYDSMVKGGSWAKLASAFAGTSPPFTRSELNSDMETSYASLLTEFIGGDTEVDEQDFIKHLRGIYNRWGGDKFELRGCFKWMDDFGDLLQSVLMSEEDVQISAEDEERFARFEHVLAAAQVLSDGLDENKVLQDSKVSDVYEGIEQVFTPPADYDGDMDVNTLKNKRWGRFFTRSLKNTEIRGIDKLKRFRSDRIYEGLPVGTNLGIIAEAMSGDLGSDTAKSDDVEEYGEDDELLSD